MRALVTGAGGQLGVELLKTAPDDFDVTGLKHSELDIADSAAVDKTIERHRPDVIINAAAYNAVDNAEAHSELAFRINATGPGNLSRAAERFAAYIIHISTDYVFDGRSDKPYRTTDATNPLNVYGKTKLAGEEEVARSGADHLIIRTSWLFSAQGRNFLQIILSALKAGKPVQAINDQTSVPTACRGLANVIWTCAGQRGPHGLRHWVDLGQATRYDQGVAVREMALAKGLISEAAPIESVPTSHFNPAAMRPRFSVLDASEFARELGERQRPWKDGLGEVLDEMSLNQPVSPGRRH